MAFEKGLCRPAGTAAFSLILFGRLRGGQRGGMVRPSKGNAAALRDGRFSVSVLLAACAAGGKRRGLVFAMGLCCPAGAEAFSLILFGTPARRAARWGRLWGFAPFSAPLASPPKHPLVLPRPTNTVFRGRLRTNLADVSASVLYDAAPGNSLPLTRTLHKHTQSCTVAANSTMRNSIGKGAPARERCVRRDQRLTEEQVAIYAQTSD